MTNKAQIALDNIQNQLENFNYHSSEKLRKKLVSAISAYEWIEAEYVPRHERRY